MHKLHQPATNISYKGMMGPDDRRKAGGQLELPVERHVVAHSQKTGTRAGCRTCPLGGNEAAPASRTTCPKSYTHIPTRLARLYSMRS